MKKAIEIAKQEIKWHEENRNEAPTAAHAEAFIKGLKHLLDLFQQAEASQPANAADAEGRCCMCEGWIERKANFCGCCGANLRR